ncbi:MAG: hypothetical protein V7664_13735 [Qipengyuania sp.]|uniref:hypothetical protein n=1 Tax=Qipengyuania sp. TaxID=2004515 RepID=UPI003002D25B
MDESANSHNDGRCEGFDAEAWVTDDGDRNLIFDVARPVALNDRKAFDFREVLR